VAAAGYDFIIVGAGTAGCVLASRLSENQRAQVLLLEAGAREPVDTAVTPAAWRMLLGTSANWGGRTVPQKFTGAVMPYARGRGLGGSSAINGLNFVRGHRSGYDAWARQGATGWGFDDLLPFFRRSEAAAGRDPALRGTSGPVKAGRPTEANPVISALVDAAVEVGYPRAGDIGGAWRRGSAGMTTTSCTARGKARPTPT
jgi:choline dehydrogenase